jgi:hypothetical protein
MKVNAQVQLDGQEYPIVMDFDKSTWKAERSFGEGDFPFIVETQGKRFEIYSDGTFAEEELP